MFDKNIVAFCMSLTKQEIRMFWVYRRCFRFTDDKFQFFQTEYLQLLGNDNTGGPELSFSGFLPDPWWLNEVTPPQDGDGLYTLWGRPLVPITATPQGTLLTTFKFKALRETQRYGTNIGMLSQSMGQVPPGQPRPPNNARTKVYDYYDGRDVTGTISSRISLTISGNEGTCGNGVINPGEECDGNNLNSKTCQLEGYPNGGTLSCYPSGHQSECKFNYGSCSLLPSYSKFNGATTDFGQVENISKVRDAILEIQDNGKISFEGRTLDFERLDLDRNVKIEQNLMSIATNENRMSLLSGVPAILTFYNVEFANPKILNGEISCLENAPKCEILEYSGGILKVKTSGFSAIPDFNIFKVIDGGDSGGNSGNGEESGDGDNEEGDGDNSGSSRDEDVWNNRGQEQQNSQEENQEDNSGEETSECGNGICENGEDEFCSYDCPTEQKKTKNILKKFFDFLARIFGKE